MKVLSAKRLKELDHLSRNLGVTFGRMGLLNEALTHSSYAAEHPGNKDFEQLEFFGDAVLKFVISEYLLERFPDYNEGELSKIRSVLVSDKILSEIGASLNLGKHILLGRMVQMRPSIIAKAMEAIIGAVYTDLGLISVQNLIVGLFGNKATEVDRDDAKDNFKAQLQEHTQALNQGIPDYTVVDIEGPQHNQMFSVTVAIQGQVISSGKGPSKKMAEQEAARAALTQLGSSQLEDQLF